MGSDERPLTVNQDSLSELSDCVSQTAGALFAAGNVTDTLSRVVELAVATIEGCDGAGLFIMVDGAVTTPVFTDSTVFEVDTIQSHGGEGPCIDAIDHQLIVYAEDLDTDLRWPHFSHQAAGAGIRSVLSLPVGPNEQDGALNLYARYPAAFEVVDRAKATILASLAGQALSVAHYNEDEERRAVNLDAALSTRETIGEALGILMERERITADEAFDILRRASQHLNIKLRDIAQNLVDTGESPDMGTPHPS